jgi:hypothetical protein
MKPRTALFVACLVSIAFAVARMEGEKSVVFQALAHVWVGLLLGVAIGRRSAEWAWLAGWLSVIEVIAFFAL